MPKAAKARDQFLTRAIARAAVAMCYQFRTPPELSSSLSAVAAQGPTLSPSTWRRLESLGLIIWNDPGWRLTPEGANVLRVDAIEFPVQLLKATDVSSAP